MWNVHFTEVCLLDKLFFGGQNEKEVTVCISVMKFTETFVGVGCCVGLLAV